MRWFGFGSSVNMRKLDWCSGSLDDRGSGESTPWVSMHIIIRFVGRLRSGVEQWIFKERTALVSGVPTRFISLRVFLGPPCNTEEVSAYNGSRRNISKSSKEVGSQNRSSGNHIENSRRD